METTFLSDLIARRTFAVTIILLLAIGLSLFSWINIPIEVMPKENAPPFLYLHVGPPVAMSPERMELALTMPVEGAVRTVANVMRFNSSTSSSGVSVSITFKPRTNMDLASFTLQEALQDLEGRGLLDMKGVTISRLNPEAGAVMKFSVTYGSEISDPAQTIKEDLRIALEAIPEISKVEINGVESPVFQFEIPSARVKEFGLEGQGLAELLNFQSLRESLGESALGSKNLLTSLSARLLMNDLSQLKHQGVAKASLLTLGEISHERLVEKNKEEISRENGQTAVFVEIYSKDGANLFEMNRHVNDALTSFSLDKGNLSRLKFDAIFNKTEDLRKAISDVFKSLYEAVLITVFVVFAFLRKWRQTLLIALSIPLALLLTILVLYCKGNSLNILTLSGLILGIGMVVDSAVLAVGRITELRSSGLSGTDAAARGAVDVRSALLMSTLTNAAIFFPVAFIEGGDSFTDILKAFQVPMLASLGASLFVSLLFLPIATIHWRDKGNPLRHWRWTYGLSASFAFFRWIQSRRLFVGALTIAVVSVASTGVVDIKQTDLEAPRELFTTINVKFAPEVGAVARKQSFEDLEKAMLAARTEIGYRFMVADFNPKFLNGSLLLYPAKSEDVDRDLDRQEAAAQKLLRDYKMSPGSSASIGFGAYAMGEMQRIDTLRLSGPKMAAVNELLQILKDKLLAITGVTDAKLEKEESGERNFIFLPDDAVIAQYGLGLNEIARGITASMASAVVSNLNLNGRSVGARIAIVPPGGEWTLADLKAMHVKVGEDREVNLLDLGRIVPMTFIRSVNRAAGLATGLLNVHYDETLDERGYEDARSKVASLFKSQSFPLGYGPPKSEADAHVREMQSKSNFVIALSGLLIYLLLGGMFESILLPFAILFTVPLALLFGVAGLRICGMDLDVMARLSLIVLVGMSVNSAIILIDLIRQLREQGLRRSEAVVIGCTRRLKAVLMTMAIQVLCVLPVALGKAKIMGIPYSSLGISVICGTSLSTLITLIVLPMVYEALDDAERFLKRSLGFGRSSFDP